MAKVMFVVRFPNLTEEKGLDAQDEEADDVEKIDEDGKLTNEDKEEESTVSLEKEDSGKDGEETSSEAIDKGELHVDDENEPSTPDSEKSENVRFNVQFEGGSSIDDDEKSTDKSTDDSIPQKNSASSLENQDSDEKLTSDGEAEKKAPEFVRLISQSSCLLEEVKQTLSALNVCGVQWSATEDDMHVGMFICDYGAQCELILKRLSMLHIGATKDSSISVFPASICIEEEPQEKVEVLLEREDTLTEKVSEFRKSIKSRLVVDQVVASVQADAVFTFDFLMLVILASFVAVMGLLEASSVVLVASMLISPLMGPILAAVFGTVIRRTDLISVGVRSEICGLGICILVGFILGLIPACLEAASSGWRSSLEWPTIEMSSRGALRSLPVGVLIAIPSGAGVALSILGGKIGSLVGVAISASLLPPAVNAGLLWANAIIVAIVPPQEMNTGIPNRASNFTQNATTAPSPYDSGHDCRPLVSNDFVPHYSCNLATENFVLGCISLLLTMLNIACIILMGIFILKLKEVAPLFHTSTRESEKDFFSKDLRIARESYATTKGKSAAAMRQQWLNEYKNFRSENKNDDCDDSDDEYVEEEIDNIIESVEDSSAVKQIVDQMPVRPQRWSLIASAIGGSTGSASAKSSKQFSFTPTSTPRDDFELSEKHLRSTTPRSVLSPNATSPQAVIGDNNAVYYTVHRYIHPRNLRSHSAAPSWKKGKFLAKLNLPQESRFMVAKIEEPPPPSVIKRNPSQLSSLQEEETSQAAGERRESEPLLPMKI